MLHESKFGVVRFTLFLQQTIQSASVPDGIGPSFRYLASATERYAEALALLPGSLSTEPVRLRYTVSALGPHDCRRRCYGPKRRRSIGGIVWMLSTGGSLEQEALLIEFALRWSAEL